MVFASLIFLLGFLPLFLAGYYTLPRRWRNAYTTVASYGFYGWWRPDFVLLMLVSTVIDFECARRIATGRRRRWLLISLLTNLGLLGYFKYANLAVDTYEALSDHVTAWQDVVLPVGISFYTFQSMSYTIDVYRGHARPVKSFLDLACYVSMFPQLVAGPIVRYATIERDLAARRHGFDKLGRGSCCCRSAWPRRSCSPTTSHRLRTSCSARRPAWSTPGSACSPTRCRSTSTSRATRTWPSGSA